MNRRFAALALAVVLCAAGIAVVRPGGLSGGMPTETELSTLAGKMAAGERLHPVRSAGEPSGTAVFCRECHPAVPHPGRTVTAGMVNEHAQRLDCLVCHWTKEAGPRPDPTWQVFPGGESLLAALPVERSTREALAGLRATVIARRPPCFVRGLACEDCHRPGGLLKIARPGSPPTRTVALERLGEYFTRPPEKPWYFPGLR